MSGTCGICDVTTERYVKKFGEWRCEDHVVRINRVDGMTVTLQGEPKERARIADALRLLTWTKGFAWKVEEGSHVKFSIAEMTAIENAADAVGVETERHGWMKTDPETGRPIGWTKGGTG